MNATQIIVSGLAYAVRKMVTPGHNRAVARKQVMILVCAYIALRFIDLSRFFDRQHVKWRIRSDIIRAELENGQG